MESVKGTHGTLVGSKETGGVIQVVTRKPQQEFGGKVSVGYGNYNTYEGKGYITGGLANGIAADLSVSYENRGDGFGRNFTTGLPTFTKDEVAVRGSILITPTDSTHIRLAADRSEEHTSELQSLMRISYAVFCLKKKNK